ncbi:MAG TPA: glycosyltransferase family 2 protein [Reyranella sp.]|nr:glycosyltransferase family 2 protein [Reyranella sp.]
MHVLLIALFGSVTAAAIVYAGFEVRLLLGYLAMRRGESRSPTSGELLHESALPTVTVQLPLFNEGDVALAIVEAACALDYPADRLKIQVLDDSTDNTPDLLAPLIARQRAAGIDIVYLRRETRRGWKAGALAWGLELSDSEFVAIFDADFAPPPDFLRRGLVGSGAFADPNVAFLQARWTYTNAFQNMLTRAQAILIDRHFAIQKPYQLINGRTLAFNGSAGIWRRSAIEAAGGWTADTLCEDLDLSYRCALKGLKGVYDFTLTCPSEIPPGILAFKLQQRRWAKGTAQCLRKLTGEIFRSRQIRHKFEDLYAMAGYVVHPIMLGYLLLWPWVVLEMLPRPMMLASQACMTIANVTIIASLFLAASVSKRRAGSSVLKGLGVALLLGMSLMVNTSLAFLGGCLGRAGVFERTPKQGRSGISSVGSAPRLKLHWSIYFEILFVAYMLWMTYLLVEADQLFQALSSLLFAASTGFLVLAQIVDRFSAGPRFARRRPASRVPVEALGGSSSA